MSPLQELLTNDNTGCTGAGWADSVCSKSVLMILTKSVSAVRFAMRLLCFA